MADIDLICKNVKNYATSILDLKMADICIIGPVTKPITHESLTNHAQIGFVRACALRNWANFLNHWGITHEPPKYHLQSLTNHWHIEHVDAYVQILCSIPQTFNAHPAHESLTECAKHACVIWRWGVSGWTCAVSNQFQHISTDGRCLSRV